MSGAGRILGERERSGERTFQKTLQRQRSVERGRGRGAESGLNRPLKVRSHLSFRVLHSITWKIISTYSSIQRAVSAMRSGNGAERTENGSEALEGRPRSGKRVYRLER